MTERPERDLEISHDLSEALDSVDHAAENVWRSIAAGNYSDAKCAIWAEHVADIVVHQIFDCKLSGSARGRRALTALGIEGRVDDRAEQRRLLSSFLAFANLNEPESQTARKKLLAFMRSQGFYRDIDENEAVKRIDRLRVEITAGRR